MMSNVCFAFATTQVHPMERVLNEQRQREEAKSVAAAAVPVPETTLPSVEVRARVEAPLLIQFVCGFRQLYAQRKRREAERARPCLTLDEDSLECAAAAAGAANT